MSARIRSKAPLRALAVIAALAALVTSISVGLAEPAGARTTASDPGGPAKTPLVAAAGALAAPQYTVQWFRNQATGFCLSAEDVGDYERVRVGDCDYEGGLPWDEWQVTVWQDGTRELRSNGLAWLCITSASTGTGTNVVLDTCDASTWQSWYVDRWGDGTIRFRNQETGLCLGHYLGYYYTVSQEVCDASQNQSWY